MTDGRKATPGVAVVTGAASGIGAAIAAELSDRGWRVAGLDMRPSGWDLGLEADVSDSIAVDAAIARVETELGPVDAVVSAAGHYEIIPVAQITDVEWTRMLRVHVGGLLNLSRAVLSRMIEAITSELAIGGGSEDAHYAAAKGAVIGLVRSLAVEVAPSGVLVNAVAPGPTDTPLLPADSPWRDASYLATLPLGRLAAPEEIALTVAFLIESGTFCSGEIISPNSGAVI
jgi:NAD(P)-dependent dehydrogenase (short-subunit alcohol dehydrogenase family)